MIHDVFFLMYQDDFCACSNTGLQLNKETIWFYKFEYIYLSIHTLYGVYVQNEIEMAN